FSLAGAVGNDLFVTGGPNGDNVSFLASASIDGNLTALLGSGNDTVSLAGTIGGKLRLDCGAGNDTCNLAATVRGNTSVTLGAGSDSFNFTGTVGGWATTKDLLKVDAGADDDRVKLAAGSAIYGSAAVWLGSGNDHLILAGTV